MAKYSIDDTTLTGIADAIREKEKTTDSIPVADFAERIGALSSKPVLLWTNLDPTVNFAAQTVTVDEGYSGYIIKFKSSATSTSPSYQYVLVGEFANSVTVGETSYSPQGSSMSRVRTCSLSGNNLIVFSNATRYVGSSYATYNNYLIPCNVWGLSNATLDYNYTEDEVAYLGVASLGTMILGVGG